jgi:hypothetical protein
VPPTNHPASPSAPVPPAGWGQGRGTVPTLGYGRGAPGGRGRGQDIHTGPGRPGPPGFGPERDRCAVM